MKKLMKRVLFCAMISLLLLSASLLRDKRQISDTLIRLHVVANSDSCSDQNLKLKVRDAIIRYIRPQMASLADKEAARAYLEENLPVLQKIVNDTLHAAGFEGNAVITLCREVFETRHYDTFSLPAGVYECLRVTIGEGKGRNWWCVAFPSLCVPVTAAGFEDAAVGAGFDEQLAGTLSNDGYEIRFFLLDSIGKLENIFFSG